jgi:lipid II:glycine glycyltransferase (peptidoglycan interpeptide bridge formation enzyme)
MTDRLTEIEKCCGMEINMEKTKEMRISSELSPSSITRDQKKQENLEYFFNYLDSVIKKYVNIHVKFNPGLPLQKQHSTGRRLFSPSNWT